MIIAETAPSGDIRVTHYLESPSVYMDHWALREFSTNPTLSKWLTSSISSRKGTLAISWINLLEFSKVTDLRQGQAIEDLFDCIIPRIFILESDPSKVISIENTILATGKIESPIADNPLLKQLIINSYASHERLTAKGLIIPIQQAGISKTIEELAQTSIEVIQCFRNEIENDPLRRKKGLSPTNWKSSNIPTRFVLRDLIQNSVKDKKTIITVNYAIDLIHTAVAASYCDFVLLDGYWAKQIENMHTKLKKHGVSIRLANAYSRRRNGLRQFMSDFEKFRDI